jgi:hypothetical protein
MDNLTEEPKHVIIRKDRKIKPMGQIKQRNAKQVGVSKKDFHAILDRASQPVKSETQSDSEKTET